MEMMEVLLAAIGDLSYVVINHPVYSAVGCTALLYGLLIIYTKLTHGVCDSDQSMEGKTVLITGATAGVGKATAEDMAWRKARVIMACRNLEKARKVANEIKSSTGNDNVVIRHLDLASFDSVRKCAQEVLNTEERLDVLINNAGILVADKDTTEDGCETVLQSNYLGHFLFTLLLLDLLRKSAPSRIVNVASKGHVYGGLDVNDMAGKNIKMDMLHYSRSKQAVILFTRELSSRLANSGVTVNTLCPGLVKTDLVNTSKSSCIAFSTKLLMYCLGKTWEEGAQTSIYLAVHPAVEKVTGKYFVDCREARLFRNSSDDALAKKLFEVTEKIVGLSYKD